MDRLKDKSALITGAARGIGAAIAEAFVAEGARVRLTDINDALGRETAQRLGPNASYARLDVREERDWRRVMDDMVGLDVLVNNAGVTGFEDGPVAHDPEHATLDAWRAVHTTNLDGVFLGCREAIRVMRPRRSGSIINMSSRSGLVGVPGAAAYASSKAAIRNHSKSVALWCAGEGLNIRCNSIHPGAILTPMWEAMLGEGAERNARLAAFSKDVPAKRFGAASEVAAIAVLLASDEAPYVTGAEFNVDGGLTAGTAASPGQ